MSDTIWKIFPRYYYPTYTDDKIISAVNMLNITSKEKIIFTNYKSVQFIDCGQELEHIYCPWCGCKVDFGFWQEAMGQAYSNGSFKYLGVQMPCCNLSSSLDELIYIKPCGFATFVIEVFNPHEMPCNVELHEMGKCFGNANFFRMILSAASLTHIAHLIIGNLKVNMQSLCTHHKEGVATFASSDTGRFFVLFSTKSKRPPPTRVTVSIIIGNISPCI